MNIIDIIRYKLPQTPLYDVVIGATVYLRGHSNDKIFCSYSNKVIEYNKEGKLYDNNDAIQALTPSREMRDWSKLAWNKGDILVNKDKNEHIIFKGFSKNDYTTFEGKHWISVRKKRHVPYLYMQKTQDYHIEDNKDSAQTYIKTIEERLDGKLNRETLEIEKTQPEFKDGDIAFADFGKIQDVFIVSGKTNLSEGYYSFIALNLNSTKALSIGYKTSFFKENLNTLRLATEEEKQQLFDALAKEGKAWDAEKKQIVDLKPKVELKPFDKVLVRDSESDNWCANLFGYIDKDEYYHCVYANWVYCIPYAGNESLLGTTKDVEG